MATMATNQVSTETKAETKAQIQEPVRFILAGDARVTFLNTSTGNRFTYRVRQKDGYDGNPIWFVGLLTGSDNEADYQYLGTIFNGEDYRHGRNSRISAESQGAKVFAKVWEMLRAKALPPQIEIWHEGRCCVCARPLTDPESIGNGIGPVCAEKGF